MMGGTARCAAVALSLALAVAPARAQLAPSCLAPSLHSDDGPVVGQRLLELAGDSALPSLAWRGSDRIAKCLSVREGMNWVVDLAPSAAQVAFNSGYAVDRNNGSLWGGRGIGTLIRTGAVGRYGPVTVGFIPEFALHENRAYDHRPGLDGSAYRNPFYPEVDLPQRWGEGRYQYVGLGQSFARVDAGPVAAGFATEALWWGAGLRESIVLGNSAPGFPHLFVEVPRGVDVWVGRLFAGVLWSRVAESPYFDTIPSNDDVFLTGLQVVFEPRVLPNLFLGAARLYSYEWSERRWLPFLDPFLKQDLVTPGNPLADDPDDQRASVFFRWLLPESGTEVYGEWGREDHSWDVQDFFQEPSHSSAYLIGIHHLRPLDGSSRLRLHGEWTNLQQMMDHRDFRVTPTYYVHLPRGHTHSGQILGAGIGPGSEAQFVGADYMRGVHSLGAFAERVRRDAMSPAAIAARATWPPQHDIELTAGVRGGATVGTFRLHGLLSYSYRMNRQFNENDHNSRIVLSARWPAASERNPRMQR